MSSATPRLEERLAAYRTTLDDAIATSVRPTLAHASDSIAITAQVVDLPSRAARRRWATSAVGLAAAAVVIVGLVAIVTTRREPASNEPPDLHWVLRDVPAGWKLFQVIDTPTAPGALTPSPFSMNLYATNDEPLGTYLAVLGNAHQQQYIAAGSFSSDAIGYDETTIDGRRAAFARLRSGDRGLYIDIDGTWAYLASNDLSDDVLIALARTITADPSGQFDIDPRALPAGLHKIGSASDPYGDVVDLTYGSPNDGQGFLDLTITPSPPALLGLGREGYDYVEVDLGNFHGYLGSRPLDGTGLLATGWQLLWRDGDVAFALSGRGLTRDQMLTAAASVSPVTEDELARLATAGDATTDTVAVIGTAPPSAATDTSVGTPHDLDITVKVTDVSDNEQRWSATLPNGQTWESVILRVFDQRTISTYIDGQLISTDYGSLTVVPPGQQASCCPATAFTDDPDADALRVQLSNGDRYTIPLHELPGTDGKRIALLGLSSDVVVLTEVIDNDGNVLSAYSPTAGPLPPTPPADQT